MEIFMRFPEGKKKALTLSYDDGVRQDKQLMDILNRHGLKCTFNINSGLFEPEGSYQPGTEKGRMTKAEALALYKDSGHEVAVHTLTHPHLETLPANGVAYEAARDRENLEEMFHTPVRGMAYPYGTLNDNVAEQLKAVGIVYSRTTISSHGFNIPRDWMRLEATCHHRDPKLSHLWEQFYHLEVQTAPQMFYIWGHSYEFDNDNNWYIIEDFAQKAGGHQEIWYATNMEIYEYTEACRRLIFSNNMKIVKNPTALTLYLEVCRTFKTTGTTVSIAPGETKFLFET